jgi:hypothetical protein
MIILKHIIKINIKMNKINIYKIYGENNIFIYKNNLYINDILHKLKNEAINKINNNTIDNFPFYKLYSKNNFMNFNIEYILKDYEYNNNIVLKNKIKEIINNIIKENNNNTIINFKSNKIKFENGKIYKIIYLKDINKIYIGSTCTSLTRRFNIHKSDAKKHINKNVYNFPKFFYNNGYDNFKIELIENYPCNSKKELEQREYDIMIEYKNNNFELLNTIINGMYDENKHGYLFGKTGEEHNLFKYGSLKCNEKNNKWIFQYQDNYHAKGKKWSVNKYGYDNAKKLAELFRIKLYPNCKAIFNYTYDKFLKEITEKISKNKQEKNNNKSTYPEFGYLYKTYIKNRDYNCYVLVWTSPDNIKENHSKYFCIDKYGEKNAEILGELFRKKTFPNYNYNFNNLTYEEYLNKLNTDITENYKNVSKMRFVSIYKQESSKYNSSNYVISWINNENITTTKAFNINKYDSEDNAYKLALLFRKKLFPEFEHELIQDINSSFEEYEQIILNNVSKKTDYGKIYKINKAKNNNTDNYVWLFKWKDTETNKYKNKSFSVNAYGDDNAKLLAELYQKKIFPELSTNHNTTYDEFINTFK